MIEFLDTIGSQKGTPINRANMMAVQGFLGKRIYFPDEANISEINENGQKTDYIFNEDGSITVRFIGEKTISKTIYFENEEILEVIG